MPARSNGFKPGISGNPNGRPKGVGAPTLFRKAILKELPEIIETLIRLAKAGDVAAAKVLIDRVVPTIKPQALLIEVEAGKDVIESGNHIIMAMLNGTVAPDTGAMLLKALADQSKLIESSVLTQRIEVLETAAKNRLKSV